MEVLEDGYEEDLSSREAEERWDLNGGGRETDRDDVSHSTLCCAAFGGCSACV